MKKSPLKLYFATFVFTLSLASFGFAGDIQCPFTSPPPPPQPSRNAAPAIDNTNPSGGSNYQFLNGFWEFLAQNTNLF